MMDVVYPLADKSKHGDDFELRYSLRSLAEQDWVGRVFLVGHCPGWARNVIHLECGDPYRAKDANIIAKVLMACEQDISQRFVVNSDDHYLLKSVTPEQLGPWLENPSRLEECRHRRSRWCRRLLETVAWCEANGHPGWVFESHIPYVVDKGRYPIVMAQVPWADGNGLVTHVYLNLTETEPRLEPETMTTRVKGPMSRSELDRTTEGRTFFNHNNAGLSPAVKAFLEERFSAPCVYEVS